MTDSSRQLPEPNLHPKKMMVFGPRASLELVCSTSLHTVGERNQRKSPGPEAWYPGGLEVGVPEFETSIVFDVVCSCGEVLDVEVSSKRHGHTITVNPCEKCLDKTWQSGNDEAMAMLDGGQEEPNHDPA